DLTFPACSRTFSSRSVKSLLASSVSGASYPVMPRSSASRITTGMPLSMQVTSIPSTESTTCPVGSRAPGGAGGVGEREADRRRRPGHTVDGDITCVLDLTSWGTERGGGDAVGVDHPDPHPAAVRVDRDQPAFDGERSDPGEEVAAVLAVGHLGLVDRNLQEQVVDVGVRVVRRGDDG